MPAVELLLDSPDVVSVLLGDPGGLEVGVEGSDVGVDKPDI